MITWHETIETKNKREENQRFSLARNKMRIVNSMRMHLISDFELIIYTDKMYDGVVLVSLEMSSVADGGRNNGDDDDDECLFYK